MSVRIIGTYSKEDGYQPYECDHMGKLMFGDVYEAHGAYHVVIGENDDGDLWIQDISQVVRGHNQKQET
jgi:hypothetical protein